MSKTQKPTKPTTPQVCGFCHSPSQHEPRNLLKPTNTKRGYVCEKCAESSAMEWCMSRFGCDKYRVLNDDWHCAECVLKADPEKEEELNEYDGGLD